MPRSKYLAAAFALALLLSCSAKPEKSSSLRNYALPEGELQMQVPSDWAEQVRQPPQGLPPTIEFRAREGGQFMVLLTPLSRSWPEEPEAAKQEIKQPVDAALYIARRQAVETEISIVEFQGASGPGFYFAATDRAPKPGEYKFMAQGVLRVQDLMVSFTVLMNDDRERVLGDALAMLKSAVRTGNSDSSQKRAAAPAVQKEGGEGGGFLFELQNPGVTVSIPEIPRIDMQPHPMAAVNPSLRAMGASGSYTVSVKVISAESGIDSIECAASLSRSIKARHGLGDSDCRLMRSSDNSTFGMYYLQREGKFLFLKAHLFSGYGGTHCIEAHITKANAAAEDIQGWMEGFPRARILSSAPQPTAQSTPPPQSVPPAPSAPTASPATPAMSGYQKTDAYFSVPRAPKGKIDLAAYAGRPVLLLLFREDCPGCQQAAGEVEILYNDYKSQGLRVVGLSMQADPRITAEFGEEYGLTYPLGYSAKEVFLRHRPPRVPFLVLLNKKHEEAATWQGYQAISGNQVTKAIEKSLRAR